MNTALRFVDHQRGARVLIAMLDGDVLAADTVMQDAIDDTTPGASAALLFAVVQLAAEVLTASTGSPGAAADILRAALGSLTADAIERGDDA